MKKVFRIQVLPAQRGDALWVEYGSEAELHHILIDGGITATGRTHLQNRIEEMGTPLHFELLVITHIDLDHILGVIELLDNLPEGVTFGDIWFNGWDQLKGSNLEPMGLKEGIALSDILQARYSDRWNSAADGAAIALGEDDSVVTYPPLPGGMAITVLAPTHAQLGKLRDEWHKVVEEFGVQEAQEKEDPPAIDGDTLPGLEALGVIDVEELASEHFDEDDTVNNGSSIALLLKFGNRTALMLGDAYPSVVTSSLNALAADERFKVDVVKLAHHGSRANTSPAFTEKLHAPTWIFSSNGANNTKHPHQEAVARVLHHSRGVRKLVFNYRTRFNEMWDNQALKEQHGYETVYGDGSELVTVTLL
jgi:beta-lactamase superfamily II metal-dependent hydrolase